MTPPPVPPFDAAHAQSVQDAEHLRLLSIFYYIWGALLALIGLLPIIHIIFGLAFVSGAFPGAHSSGTGFVLPSPSPFPEFPDSGFQGSPSPFPGSGFPGSPSSGFPTGNPTAPPAFFGWFFVVAGTFALLAAEVTAALTLYAGRCLAKREKKSWIQVAAALNCLSIPIGTVLGVFTFIVLSRPTVALLFNRRSNS